jgi:TRAP-type C4-dicarboxylate transport system substrate-binding protein
LKSAGSLDALAFGILLPYFFKDIAEVDRTLAEGGMMDKINAVVTKKGVRVLAMVPLGLPAGIMNTKKPVESVADMADLRMRALDKRQIALFQAWGTNGTIVSWSEVPNALQTGIADGYLNPPIVPLMFGHTGFIKHFTDARISTSARLAIASEDWYQGLAAEQRKIVDDAVAAANKAQRAWLATRGDSVLKKLESAGVKVVKLSDEARAEFQKRSKNSWVSEVLTADQVAQWEEARDRVSGAK